MTAKGGFLRRAQNYPGGISAGGGDTGFDTQPQKTTLLKRVATAVQDVILPKGTVLLSTIVMPDPDAPTAAGTVTIEKWDISAGEAVGDPLADAVDATVYSETIVAVTTDDGEDPPEITGFVAGGTILAADTRFRITPASITADKAALAGFEVMLPRTRI